ncbi:hypothetical protein B5C34_08785 [Pacificimonas flava]|uniref:Uncharacterized protein n=2 Tax=Pacificimonas TaxID=1960290 RepID=A0A219B5C7_9SPHN|nr:MULTISPECIES: class I SAM-dependent methyltransferase [Pacificimonas]MBZ6379239.1 class I SAM-dependent methyltransferase [Pacificimonas aurantium]OWV33547.1 hypothetical protein B5C34_08785 [Pacificimonas flava]
MANLLIHSMSEFSDIIIDCLTLADARNIVEIGAEFGGMSQVLADFAGKQGGRLTSIDPAPKAQFLSWVGTSPHVTHVNGLSLDVLPEQKDADAWVIDGDHNYYTVFHELKGIDALCRRDDRPFLAFLHDVSWPSARRDMYYAPEQIPAEWRHEYDYEGGAVLDTNALIPGRGFRGCGSFAFARQHGGPRNGVLTAVEDAIVHLRETEGRDLVFAHVPAVFGLGILFDTAAPWAEAVAQRVLPLHQNQLLATLEENRLRNYLQVIDFQDDMAARAA